MTSGILELQWWGYALVAVVLTHLTIASVTIFLHRHQTHRALDLHPAVAHCFRAWLWLTSGTVTKEWVAVHRKHHGRVETADDPHSPQRHGLQRVLWLGFLLYRKAASDPLTLKRFGRGTPDDWLERNLYARYSWAGITLMALIDLVCFGIGPGSAVWTVQMVCLPLLSGGIVNGVGHYFGYRNFELRDASHNILPWGAALCGEELHNNHHTYPNSARLAVKWWELDLGWWYIRGLAALRLARVKRVPPRSVYDPEKIRCDLDTVRAVAHDRFQVMASYAREVIYSVCRSELPKTDIRERVGGMPARRARKALIQRADSLDDQSRGWLADVLERSQALRTVYGMKERLGELTHRSTANQEALVEALESWCRQAEATKIQALARFSRRLRSYTLSRFPG
jgi:stearoyl-CoA desaturase (delta-9 desaturase)